MVMSNRDLGNKQFLSLAFTSSTVQMASLSSAMEMDIDKVNNFDDIRGRFSSFSKVSSKSTSISSNIYSILYYKRMVINNNLPDKEFKEFINSSQLSYQDDS